MTRYSSYVLRAIFLVSLCSVLVVRWMSWMWSESVDLGVHYVLTARLAEFWSLPPATFDTTDKGMYLYPPLSHALAALIGSFFNSPLIGLQVLVLVSILAIWSSIVYLILSLPRSYALISSVIMVVFLAINKLFLHAEVYGDEVNYFFMYAHLVAQSLVLLAIATILYAEQFGITKPIRYLILSGFILLATSTHLTPALVLLGFFVALVGLEIAIDSRSTPPSNAAANVTIGLLFVCATTALVIASPFFKAMRQFAAWNGGLTLTYISSMKQLVLLCLIVLAGSCGILLKWLKLDGDSRQRRLAAMKYIGLYGISVAGLCLLQILALKLGYGSEYAAKKYVYGLNTVILLELALSPLLISRADSGIFIKRGGTYSYVQPLILIAISFICVVSSRRTLDVPSVVSVESQIRTLRDAAIPGSSGKYNYVVNVRGGSPTIDYMMSVGVLHAPSRSPNSLDILWNRELSELGTIGTLVTSEHSRPYDIEGCRRFVSASGIVLLDGSCVARALFVTTVGLCQGKIDFSKSVSPAMLKGFSDAERFGRWTVGSHASFLCKIPAEEEQHSKSVKIVTQAFASGMKPQRVSVSINGGIPNEYRYEAGQVENAVELPLPHMIGEIRISFLLPDADGSSQEMGARTDPGKHGIVVRSIEFN